MEQVRVVSCGNCRSLILTYVLSAATLLYLAFNVPAFSMSRLLPVTSSLSRFAECHDVLRNMLRGRWHQDVMTLEEVEKMRALYRETQGLMRYGQHTGDRCGMQVGRGYPDRYFRTMCDPDGDAPCCYDHVCRNMSLQQCTCPTCLHMRSPIYAEYATWRTLDPSCQPWNWSVSGLCQLLKNSTLVFIGDSLMRHLYTAFLLKARDNPVTGALQSNVSNDTRSACSGQHMFIRKRCRPVLDRDARLCNGSVLAKFFFLPSVKQARTIHKVVLGVPNSTRSMVFFGIGVHDFLKRKRTKTTLLRPLFKAMRSRQLSRPHLVWAGVHQLGMMRLPLKSSDGTGIRGFNQDIQHFLDGYHVPVFDTYNLTDNVMSLDGIHYGYGVNTMKVNIFLHYIHELKSLGKW
ncbi:uncharacterized protein LOC143280579 [Babylonia areolata]|uniref:uncharacterized protein LOC143280579 n=1 Tax=Babylonia areolata TaxID=304850 RepID=UPI003FCFB364